MSFGPDPSKQARVIFSRKTKKTDHLLLDFNNTYISQAASEKHLGIVLDTRLTLEEHLKGVVNKTNKTIGLLFKLQNILPLAALIATYKTFDRPHLDYGISLYDIYLYKNIFHEKIESFQYNACLALTEAISGTSKEKLY